jgi:hypothetical protein
MAIILFVQQNAQYGLSLFSLFEQRLHRRQSFVCVWAPLEIGHSSQILRNYGFSQLIRIPRRTVMNKRLEIRLMSCFFQILNKSLDKSSHVNLFVHSFLMYVHAFSSNLTLTIQHVYMYIVYDFDSESTMP